MSEHATAVARARAQVTAVRDDHVVILPKDLFQYKPNARWAEAYDYLAKILYPDAVN